MTALFVGFRCSERSAELAEDAFEGAQTEVCAPCSGATRLVLLAVDHLVQMGCGLFNVIVLVLAGAALCGDHCATMHSSEIAEWKLVSALGVRRTLVINTEMPFRERFDSVHANEFIFLLS